MINQIGQATHYLFVRIAIRHLKHFLHTFPKQTLNNFYSQDYLKAFKYHKKLISNTYLILLFTKVSHTRFTLPFHVRIYF